MEALPVLFGIRDIESHTENRITFFSVSAMPSSVSELMLTAVRVACAEVVSEIGYAYAQDSVCDQ
jgi:hypothetical protein